MTYPVESDSPAVPPLRVLAWELTRACGLACRHCRASAQSQAGDHELSTDEALRVIADLSTMGRMLLILTGGDPMRRSDLLALCRTAVASGHRVAVAPCGPGFDRDAARSLVDAGVCRISLSWDAADADQHDAFRGVPGAMQMVRDAMAAAREAGLDFQVNTTVHRGNVDQLPAMSRQVVDSGAVGWDLFLLVPTGRGRALAGQSLDADQYESTLQWIAHQSQQLPLAVKVTCAPQYVRICRAMGMDGGTACLGGRGFGFLSHEGDVQICGFLPIAAGNVRHQPLSEIWRSSPFLTRLRDDSHLGGKCGRCQFHQACRGCRARAHALLGDPMGPDPMCRYQPSEGGGR